MFASLAVIVLIGSLWPSSVDGCTNLMARSYGQSFSSINYPFSYSSNTWSCWQITTEFSWKYVRLSIDSFTTESSYDVVKVYSGSSSWDTEIAEWSGSLSSSWYVTSYGNQMYITFDSDNSVSYSGFQLTYYETSSISSYGGLNDPFYLQWWWFVVPVIFVFLVISSVFGRHRYVRRGRVHGHAPVTGVVTVSGRTTTRTTVHVPQAQTTIIQPPPYTAAPPPQYMPPSAHNGHYTTYPMHPDGAYPPGAYPAPQQQPPSYGAPMNPAYPPPRY